MVLITNSIRTNLGILQKSIQNAHNQIHGLPGEVKLVGVSKGQPVEKIRVAFSLGLRDFGENYAQELLAKNAELSEISSQINWHFIGHLQQNKVKKIVPLVHLIQSVDSVALAQKIDAVSGEHHKISNILIEINIGNEQNKSGIRPSELQTVIGELKDFSNIQIQGLMCMPPLLDTNKVRPFFAQTKRLFDSLFEIKQKNLNPTILSMGTSSDFETAIQEESTMVRIGTKLFGDRN